MSETSSMRRLKALPSDGSSSFLKRKVFQASRYTKQYHPCEERHLCGKGHLCDASTHDVVRERFTSRTGAGPGGEPVHEAISSMRKTSSMRERSSMRCVHAGCRSGFWRECPRDHRRGTPRRMKSDVIYAPNVTFADTPSDHRTARLGTLTLAESLVI
jgi:hypothetical protein